jgi:hypothetical protein
MAACHPLFPRLKVDDVAGLRVFRKLGNRDGEVIETLPPHLTSASVEAAVEPHGPGAFRVYAVRDDGTAYPGPFEIRIEERPAAGDGMNQILLNQMVAQIRQDRDEISRSRMELERQRADLEKRAREAEDAAERRAEDLRKRAIEDARAAASAIETEALRRVETISSREKDAHDRLLRVQEEVNRILDAARASATAIERDAHERARDRAERLESRLRDDRADMERRMSLALADFEARAGAVRAENETLRAQLLEAQRRAASAKGQESAAVALQLAELKHRQRMELMQLERDADGSVLPEMIRALQTTKELLDSAKTPDVRATIQAGTPDDPYA